jgi:hypothetical protein
MKKDHKIPKITFVLAICFFMLTISVYGMTWLPGGSGTKETPHRVPRTTSNLKIDGVLNEKAWEEALVLELNYEVIPGENIKPPVRTEVLLIYSDTRFYAAFRAYDPVPSAIRARIRERDNFGGDDWVAIALDTFNDERRAYNFCCNPFGVQADEITSPEGGGEAWDAIWYSAGRLNKEGYIVEMAIPFSSLRFQRKRGQQVWGIDALRSYPICARQRNWLVLPGLHPGKILSLIPH